MVHGPQRAPGSVLAFAELGIASSSNRRGWSRPVVPSPAEASRARFAKGAMSQRAFAAPANAPCTLPGRALVILATLSVILAPSIYRGGADVAHPHGFFEFWGSDAERAFDHHGHTREHDHNHQPAGDGCAAGNWRGDRQRCGS